MYGLHVSRTFRSPWSRLVTKRWLQIRNRNIITHFVLKTTYHYITYFNYSITKPRSSLCASQWIKRAWKSNEPSPAAGRRPQRPRSLLIHRFGLDFNNADQSWERRAPPPVQCPRPVNSSCHRLERIFDREWRNHLMAGLLIWFHWASFNEESSAGSTGLG